MLFTESCIFQFYVTKADVVYSYDVNSSFDTGLKNDRLHTTFFQ